MKERNVDKVSFWGSRIVLYFLLTSIAVLLMFPLIYMVSASLKTTGDYNSNPRRLFPYTQSTTSFNGLESPLYAFEINDEATVFLPAQVTANRNDKARFANLVTLDEATAAQSDVLLILPIESEVVEGDAIDLTAEPLHLVQTSEAVVFTIDDVLQIFQVFAVEQNNAPVTTYLQSTQAEVPLSAYIRQDAAYNTETLDISLDAESGMFMVNAGNQTLQALAIDARPRMDVFIQETDYSKAVFAFERTATSVEEIEFQFGNYDLVLGRDEENTDFRLDRALVNTAFVTILVTLGQITTSLFGGYAFSRISFRGRDTLFLVYLGSIMVPFVVLIVPIFRLMVALGWNDHLVSLIVPWIFTAYGTFLIRQFFLSIPKEIEEAALLDGCSRFRILWNIFIPLSTPAIATHAIFTFLYAWNSFLWPLIIINTGNKDDQVLTLALITLSNINVDKPNLVMTGAAVMILPPMLVFILAQKYFIEGIATSGLKG